MMVSGLTDEYHTTGLKRGLPLLLKLTVYQLILKGGPMYYLTERSVMANEPETVLEQHEHHLYITAPSETMEAAEKETVFSQADLWNLQKHMKTIHVTDRLPRTWEGLW